MVQATSIKRTKRGSATAAFGTVTRSGHDSSSFYNKKLYSAGGITEILNGGAKSKRGEAASGAKASAKSDAKKNLSPAKSKQKPRGTNPAVKTNIIHCGDSQNMKQIPDGAVDLMITSPPYNVGKEYDDDLSLAEYTELLRGVFSETHRVLGEGGRACINIANIGRKPYIPLHAIVIKLMDELGFIMRGEIIWNKEASAGGSCAWGSWQSASNPVLRDVHEYILVYSKGSYSRKSERESTIERQEFLDFTKSIWSFHATSARRAGHPAPFPVELPRRLIELYSFKDDIVLDPFMGSGSTAIAALRCGRRYIGYDISKDYVKLAADNISKAQEAWALEQEKNSMNLPLRAAAGK